jgi:DNA primase
MAETSATQLDPARLIEIYSTFIDALTLSDAHAEALATARGLSADTIAALKFRSGGNRRVIEHALDATRASEDELLAAGLMVRSERYSKIEPWFQLLNREVIIPYLDANGGVYHLRPHKFGFPKEVKAIEWYAPFLARAHPADPYLIITEGEFKSAALHQLGYATLAVPGISSFVGKHFGALKDAISKIQPKSVLICFDREVKDTPGLGKYIEERSKRYATEEFSWRMAWLLRDFGAKVARLPAEWMEDGKIDCDGALAAGKTRADFESCFRSALSPDRFVESLQGDAGVIVRLAVVKHLKTNVDPRLTARSSVTQGDHYLWTEPSGADGVPPKVTKLSNFTLTHDLTVYTDTQAERIVRFNKLGESSKPVVLTPGDLTPNTAFQRWCHTHGPYTWKGKDQHLRALSEWLDAQDNGSFIRRTVMTGEVEPGVWLLKNALITDGQLVLPDTAGICWHGRYGYQMEPDDVAQPTILGGAPAVPELGDKHVALLHLLLDAFGGRALPWLGIGWGLATLFSRALFAMESNFPLLFCWGEKGSGKTTFCRWLMHGLFGLNTHGQTLGSTEKGGMRLLAKRCSLPGWFDEFRDEKSFNRHVAAFTSAYNRQGYGRAKRTGDYKTDTVPVNGTVLLAGINPPRDESLQSRCIFLPFTTRQRSRTAFQKVTKEIETLNALMVYALLHYDRLEPLVVAETRATAQILFEETGDSRLAANYSKPIAAFKAVLGDLVDCAPLFTYAETVVRGAEDRLAEEHPLNEFWAGVERLAGHRVSKEHMAAAPGDEVWVWLSGVYALYATDHRMRTGEQPPLREATLRSMLQEQPYFVRMDKRRLKGTQRRVAVLRLADCPEHIEAAMEALHSNA